MIGLACLLSAFVAGCKPTDIKDEGNAEKAKEQGAIDKRANAIDSMTKSGG